MLYQPAQAGLNYRRAKVTRYKGERRSEGRMIMEKIILKASRRDVTGKKVKALRREGLLPAIIYGKGVEEPVSILMNLRESTRILKSVSSSSILTIDVDGEEFTTLIRERQRIPIVGDYMHIDFLAVSLTDTVRTMVNLSLEGESPAVKDFSALLITGADQIEVESLPQDLPERVVVSIDSLVNIGDGLYVKDLEMPENVSCLSDPEEMIVVVTAPTLAAEEEVGEEEILDEDAEPEVIEKGKQEEE